MIILILKCFTQFYVVINLLKFDEKIVFYIVIIKFDYNKFIKQSRILILKLFSR